MRFDKETRNLLAKTVTACRRRLIEDVTDQLRGTFGLHEDGTMLPLDKLTHLSPDQNSAARRLRDLLDHYTVGAAGKELDRRKGAYERMVLEISFTVLNRLAALRLCEERGLVVECVRKGTSSAGFQMFERISGGAIGGRYDTYRVFLESLFDEFALDLGVLFDRMTPQSAVFPTERCMEDVLVELNKPELTHIWTEDETIGWVYQYFNPRELRDAIKRQTKVPRNSYEIAIRSSYYTPRFVVEFLTDNTLGRIWYEMRKGNTALREKCRYLVRRPNEVFLAPDEEAPSAEETEVAISQTELLNKPVYIPHRPLKDPRDIKMLDIACGSMHFGLYSFDLFECMYGEAWNLEEQLGGDVLLRSAGLNTFHKTYGNKDTFLRHVPRLILEHNIHGIDIDPRAVQIAALAIWLRAQKAWKNLGVKTAERPPIRKSNIVVAEPMPGEEGMRREFTAGLKPRVLGQLVDVVFKKMKLAGEAGSLLKIEEEIKDAIADARKQWLEVSKPEQQLLFPGMAHPRHKQQELRFDLKGITDERFWEQAEDRILDALKEYAEQAENGHATRRRLFAEDAARGFAFIDICRQRYDVVLMNPPYAETEGELQSFLKTCYPTNWTNLYSAFIERGLTVGRMRVGFVCPNGFLSAYRMRNLRSEFVEQKRLESLSCLGKDVFDEMGLSTIAMVLNSRNSALHPVLVELNEDGPGRVDYINRAVVNERTNHILTPDLIRSSTTGWSEKPLSPTFGLVTQGNRTFDDFRFVRAWWEVSPNRTGDKWQRWQKGGEYQPFFSSTPYVTDWEKRNDGASMRCFGVSKVGTDAQVAQSSRYWWRSGLVGPAMNTTGAGFNIRILPKSQIFSAKSTVIIPKGRKQALILLSLLNSRTLRWFLYQQGAGLAGNTGKIKKLPIIWPDGEAEQSLESLAYNAVMLMAELESFRETSPCFKDSIRQHADLVERYRECVDRLDATVSVLYQQDVEDEAVRPTLDLAESALVEATDGHILKPHGDSLLVYCLGIVVGRWDVRIALDPSLAPKLPDPFDPLPVCPPGMLVGPDGLPAETGRIVSEEWLRARLDANKLPLEGSVKNPTVRDDGYPLRISWDGIVVDDPGLNGGQPPRDDIVHRIREALDLLWRDKANEIEQEACEILGVSDLREYFRKPSCFFQDHLKRYSKSRRKAPIYWPLSTISGSYTLWLYYPRLTDQTLYVAVNKYVEPKIVETERGIARIEYDLKAASGREATRLNDRLSEARTFLGELRELREELLRIAGLPYKPNLNDGVIINAAPFHNLFRLRSWAKDTEDCWKKLENGDYDWAHLAYTIWPDRVREVCKTDRSIAIAHGLEEICEAGSTQKTKGGKERRRQEATTMKE